MIICIILLTGCWDQRNFKNVKLVLTAGFDLMEDGQINTTVSLPTILRSSDGAGQERIQVVSAIGRTPRDTRDKIDRKISNSFAASKLEVLLVGEELAKQDLYPPLDVFYRDPRSNLNAKIAVVKGEASEAIRLKIEQESRISKYLGGLLQAMENTTHSPGENLQLICAEMFEPGQDFVLPLLRVNEEASLIEYDGLALFNERSYTGKDLDQEEAVLMMLLNGQKGKTARMTFKVREDGKQRIMNYATIHVYRSNSRINVTTSGSNVTADIKLHMRVDVIEYPKNHLETVKEVKKIKKELKKQLTQKSEEIFAKLKDTNSDVFGIGRRVAAYYPDVWKQLDKKNYLENVTFNPDIEIVIQQHGIIN
ncbi:Ger(x)C family spore germination protein [Thalassobacillus pellis]|uniref:Ger(x)C family spore germination protein n=1 Tax=Thalassobacillus pellis TaxID=748008 RepID=UPI0019620062|nr:Ger(x)C family germination protein [Thalassobacillus pellis]